MTCREKYVKDHPGMLLCITRSGCIPPECPADYGYLEDPSYCELDVACRMCWDREIPGTENEEKENNMGRLTKRTETGVAYLVEPLVLASDDETRGRVHRLVDRLADFEDGSEIENFYKAKFIEAEEEIKKLNEEYRDKEKALRDQLHSLSDLLDKKREVIAEKDARIKDRDLRLENAATEIVVLKNKIEMYHTVIRAIEAVTSYEILRED